jgi:transcriptional regulator with XRE-family HTH domain
MPTKRQRFLQRRKSLGLTQEVFADQVGVDRSTVQRWEAGHTEPQPWLRPRIATVLDVSPDHLDDLLHDPATIPLAESGTAEPDDHLIVRLDRPASAEIEDMRRRDLLRLVSMTGALLALPPLDTDRISHATTSTAPLDGAAVEEYARLNAHLWRVFTLTSAKQQTLPLIRQQLDVLVTKLGQPHTEAVRRQMSALLADLFQLAGEVFFDADRYTDAAHCYTQAASAAQHAGAVDLWACALVRHAFLAMYDGQHTQATPMLGLAATLAHRGDPGLSTRHWVAAVHAENAAALDDLPGCQRSLDTAEAVTGLSGEIHNGGWLRFDGARLAEQRGACFATLGRTDLAETALTTALTGPLTTRRRAGVLTDLAAIGAQRRDPDQVVVFADAAVDTAQQTGSGVIKSKLRTLRPHLAPLLGNPQVRRLDDTILALAG